MPFHWFDRMVGRSAEGAAHAVGRLARCLAFFAIGFLAFVAATARLFQQRPTAFVPQEDQGYFLADVALPKGASVERTVALIERLGEALLGHPAVAGSSGVAGRGILSDTTASFFGFRIPTLKPWGERAGVAAVIADIRAAFRHDPDGQVRIVNPAPLPGLGSRGGLTLELQDRSGQGGLALTQAADAFLAEASALPEVGRALPTSSYGVPQIRLDIDRAKAEQLGVKLETLFDTLGTYVGSSFVNLLNQFGFVYQVYVQGEGSARRTLEDLEALTVPNMRGEPVRIGSLISAQVVAGPTAVLSYNTYPAIEVAVETAAGFSSGAAIAAIERLAERRLPTNHAVAWTDMAYQEKLAGGSAPLIFGFGIFMVFLVLAAQYESLRLPLVILLGTPLAVSGALAALALRGLPLDIFGQIGLLLLVGLAAKNSILLVAFAQEARERGADATAAAQETVRLRLRPILMTSFAFILGCVPLVIASGAGANVSISIGTVVIGALLLVPILSLVVTPGALHRLRAPARGDQPRVAAGRRQSRGPGRPAGVRPDGRGQSADARGPRARA
ncbi:efflux RND transporter permease subunit [Dankookia sp. GCM10030260]|uniref:efflux RND transporter permease subunit n=1 Tax=Dankookia sp. GCM10030260 TaxID=3273390 RepID=UPI00360BB959